MKLDRGRFFPDSLIDLPIWILWKTESGKGGSPTKVPYSAKYEGRASSTNPNTWTTFSKALAKLEKSGSKYAGVGICVRASDRLIFTDIDYCVDEDGQLNETALDILEHMPNQFVELSQSGSGLHILSFGEIPRSFKNSRNGVEMYDDKRFVALTGLAIVRGEPHDDPYAVQYVYEHYCTQDMQIEAIPHYVSGIEHEDNWVIDHAKQHGVFPLLYSGNWIGLYGSQSEADLALCMILAFWCDCNEEQMDRIFRSSGLYRRKWDREDYRNRTIRTAIAKCSQSFSEFLQKEEAEFERAFFEEW